MNEVRVKDVVESFPLTQYDSQHKYLLRFQTVMQINPTRKLVTWMDLDHELDVQAPNVKGKIIIKALRLPKGVELKAVPKQIR